jgi:hypothetical protein
MFDFEGTPVSKMSASKRALVCGVGINDCEFVVNARVDGKSVFYQPYSTWLNMIKRAYSENFHARRPTYRGVSVCDDWLKFSGYLKWHKENSVDGWSLDKDIIGDGTIYSPDVCIFIPKAINNFIEDAGAVRGDCRIGVSKTRSGSYHSYCRDPFLKKRVNIGYYATEEEAFLKRLEYKLGVLDKYKPNLDLIDGRLFFAIMSKIRSQR